MKRLNAYILYAVMLNVILSIFPYIFATIKEGYFMRFQSFALLTMPVFLTWAFWDNVRIRNSVFLLVFILVHHWLDEWIFDPMAYGVNDFAAAFLFLCLLTITLKTWAAR